MTDFEQTTTSRLRVAVPGADHHRDLISCQFACPVKTDARGYVRAIADGRFEEAYLIARGPNPFASICGRVCGAPCEAACRRGKIPRTDSDGSFVADDFPIAIRALKRFACERAGHEARPGEEALRAVRGNVALEEAGPDELAMLLRAFVDQRFEKGRGERVAVIGAGPAGLSAAHDLALMGFSPVVFETEPVAAGMLVLGVPAYRLSRNLIRWEVSVIEALGVEIRCGVTVGRDVSFADLRRDFKAVIMAVGAKKPRSLGIPGEQGPHVFGGVDFLRAVALGEPVPVGSDVVVIGGGNVAYDVARTVLRQAAYDAARTAARLAGTKRVRLVSLETLEEMPADTLEIREGDEEGIERLNGFGPLEIRRDGSGRVEALEVRRCLRVYDENRRFAPVFDDAQRMTLECDSILIAAGQAPDLGFLAAGGSDIEMARPGWPKTDPETLATSVPHVFVAGDLAHGTRLIIDAVASGKKAARSVYRLLMGRPLEPESVTAFLTHEGYARELGYEAIPRVAIPACEPAERMLEPGRLVEVGYGAEEACKEASRCLDCAVTPVFDGNRCVLCGGCADVCPTLCLKLVSLDGLEPTGDVDAAIARALGPYAALGPGAERTAHSAIVKDEDRCIRCGLCAMRCPSAAITMERVMFHTRWRTDDNIAETIRA